jgi:hypothetical protein
VTESEQTLRQFPHRTTVGGEEWVVQARENEPGAYSFSWVSGPNPGYGFSSKESDGHACTEDELNEAIRDFLADIGAIGSRPPSSAARDSSDVQYGGSYESFTVGEQIPESADIFLP